MQKGDPSKWANKIVDQILAEDFAALGFKTKDDFDKNKHLYAQLLSDALDEYMTFTNTILS